MNDLPGGMTQMPRMYPIDWEDAPREITRCASCNWPLEDDGSCWPEIAEEVAPEHATSCAMVARLRAGSDAVPSVNYTEAVHDANA